MLRQDCNAKTNIKLGLCNTEGLAFYLRGDELLRKTVDKADRYGEYPDMVCSMETYTSQHMLEVETLSEVKNIEPNQLITHTEVWDLFDKTNAEYIKVKQLIG